MKFGNAFKDKIGQRFGRLVVLKVSHKNKQGNYIWLCQCDCGNKVTAIGGNLGRNLNHSCGCYLKEFAGAQSVTHGMSYEKFYNVFRAIKSRCNNPKCKMYNYYGGRGIRNEWGSFEQFKIDMHETYLEHCKQFGQRQTTIDRIDNNGNYSKKNCRWATRQEQAYNTSQNRLLTFQGTTLNLTQWANKFFLDKRTLWDRLKRGWNLEKALLTRNLNNHI